MTGARAGRDELRGGPGDGVTQQGLELPLIETTKLFLLFKMEK